MHICNASKEKYKRKCVHPRNGASANAFLVAVDDDYVYKYACVCVWRRTKSECKEIAASGDIASSRAETGFPSRAKMLTPHSSMNVIRYYFIFVVHSLFLRIFMMRPNNPFIIEIHIL